MLSVFAGVVPACLAGDYKGLIGVDVMSAGFASLHPTNCPSIPPSPSSQEDGDEREPVENGDVGQLSPQSPDGEGLVGYSPLGPSAESESLGDAPLSPLIKSSLSEELSENLLGLGLDPVTFAAGAEHPGSRTGVALAAGSTDSCFSGGGAATDRETLSTVSSYRSEKTDSTQLESPSLGQVHQRVSNAPSAALPQGKGPLQQPCDVLQGGSDTDDLSDSVLLRSPSKELSSGQVLDRTLVEGEDLPHLLTDIAHPNLQDSSPSSSGPSETCDLDGGIPIPPLPPPRQASSVPSGLALGLVCSEPALPVSAPSYLLADPPSLQAQQQVVRPKDLKLLRVGGSVGHRPGRRKAPRKRGTAGSSSFDCGSYRRHHNRSQHRDYIPVRSRLGAKAYSESLFEDSTDEDDGSDMSAGSSLGSQRRFSSDDEDEDEDDDSSSSTSCYSPDLANAGIASQPGPVPQLPSPGEGEEPDTIGPTHSRSAQRSASTASAKTHARVLSMDGAGGGSNNTGTLASTLLPLLPSSTAAPRLLTISKSDLEARTVHAEVFSRVHHRLDRLDSLGGSWAGNQTGWRAGDLLEEGAVGGGKNICLYFACL